jgi:ribosome maturation factor RimP
LGAMDLETLVGPVVEAAGLQLVDVTFRREARGQVLRVTVDREGGVDLDAIAKTSERVSRRLDIEGFDPGRYTLEVSSPGLERPLRKPEDFARRIGERVRVRTAAPLEGARTHTGSIVSADEEAVTVETEAGPRNIPFRSMTSARTVFEWNRSRK